MRYKYFIPFLLFVFNLTIVEAQSNKFKISGTVTDINNNPIKGAIIFIDSIKTNVITNKKGFYKIKLDQPISEIAVFSSSHGLLSKIYNGEKKVSFIFREKNEKLSEENLIVKLGYKTNLNKTNESVSSGSGYQDFANIFELLNKRFPYVKIRNGQIVIGKGPNSFGGDASPLILIDDVRSNIHAMSSIPTSEIDEIKVIWRGSEASAYGGLMASNGVIIINLKK